MNTEYLSITWSISRGRDTDGYNICRLDAGRGPTQKRYKCMGGGYDMIGTVLADWLEEKFQDRLVKIADRAAHTYPTDEGMPKPDRLYGMSYYKDENRVSIDGACGVSSVEEIAKAIGVEFQWVGNRKGSTIGYVTSWEDES